MSTVEYGRHARRILEWDEVDVDSDSEEALTDTQVDLSHGSVFQVEEEAKPPTLLESVSNFLKIKLKR